MEQGEWCLRNTRLLKPWHSNSFRNEVRLIDKGHTSLFCSWFSTFFLDWPLLRVLDLNNHLTDFHHCWIPEDLFITATYGANLHAIVVGTTMVSG